MAGRRSHKNANSYRWQFGIIGGIIFALIMFGFQRLTGNQMPTGQLALVSLSGGLVYAVVWSLIEAKLRKLSTGSRTS